MLRIYNKQIDIYQKELDKRLSTIIYAFVQEECTKELNSIPNSIVLRWVENGIQQAKSHLLESEYSIGLFVSLLIKVGFSFDKQLDIQKVINRTDLTDNQKIDLLLKTTTEQQWLQAELLAE